MTPVFRVFKVPASRHTSAMAGDIAARCARGVLRQMRAVTSGMEAAELRGYIRALAMPMVRAEIQLLLSQIGLIAADERELNGIALDRTIQLVNRELQSPPIIAIALPHVSSRAAA